jgi:hypothetical protein
MLELTVGAARAQPGHLCQPAEGPPTIPCPHDRRSNCLSSYPARQAVKLFYTRRTGGQTVLLYPAHSRVICASLQRGQQIPCPQNRRSNCSIIPRRTGGQTVDYTLRTAGHLCQPAEGPTNYNTLPAEQAVKLFYYTPHNRRSNCLYPAHSGSSVPVRRRYNICRIDGQSVLVWLVRRLYIRTQAVKLC